MKVCPESKVYYYYSLFHTQKELNFAKSYLHFSFWLKNSYK